MPVSPTGRDRAKRPERALGEDHRRIGGFR
jgi:hypothetical protein